MDTEKGSEIVILLGLLVLKDGIQVHSWGSAGLTHKLGG